MRLNFQDLQWIGEHERLFVANNRPSDEQRNKIYELYNKITDENKKPNGCGRCYSNVKKRVWKEFERNTNIF